MNSKVKHLGFLALTAILILSRCADDGEQGPIGPKGDKGDQGEQGIQGEQGEPGTANVSYSEWMDIVWNGEDGSTFKRMDIEEPMVLGDFMDSGTILMYLKLEVPDGTVIVQLPYLQGGDFLYFVMADAPAAGVEGIAMILTATDGTPVQSDWSDYQIRYVLIPGGVPLSEGRAASVDYSDYEAVKAFYNIPD